jgi:hypothetical protein
MLLSKGRSGPPSSLVMRERLANNGRAAPTKAAIKDAKKGAKDGKKGQKCRPSHVAVVVGNGDSNEEAGDSDEEFVAATKCHFKRHVYITRTLLSTS